MNIQPITTASARQTAVIDTRCPHGGFPGSCPQCGGGGGGGGGAKAPGLMNWNEAYAAWKSIQLANMQKADMQKGLATNQLRAQSEAGALTLRGMATAMVARMIQGAMPLFMTIRQVLSSPARPLAQIATMMQNTLTRIFTPLVRVMDISDRLATLLGEAKKLLEDILQHNIENLKSLVAQFDLAEKLAHIERMLEKAMKRWDGKPILGTLKQKLQSVLSKLRGWFEHDADEDDFER